MAYLTRGINASDLAATCPTPTIVLPCWSYFRNRPGPSPYESVLHIRAALLFDLVRGHRGDTAKCIDLKTSQQGPVLMADTAQGAVDLAAGQDHGHTQVRAAATGLRGRRFLRVGRRCRSGGACILELRRVIPA